MDSREMIPLGARKVLSSALIDLGASASRIGERLWATAPASGSRAEALLDGQDFSSAGLNAVAASFSAGTDHFHAFSRVIRMEEQFGPAIAVLSRAGIEVLGRGWWLLESGSGAQLRHRLAAMHLADVHDFVAKGGKMERVFPDGRRVPETDPIGNAERELARHQVPKKRERVPSYAQLATTIMSAADVRDPKDEYSHLSGAAHGHESVISSFNVFVDGGSPGEVTIALPIRNGRMYMWTFGHVLSTFVDHIVSDWGLAAEADRWGATKARVDRTMDIVFDELDRFEPEN